MVGAVVPLTVGGPGAIAPASVTTDAGGEATALYSVPADTVVTDANVNAVLTDGTSAALPITINTLVLVSVSPTTATLNAGQSIDLTATVTGTLLTGVTWTATGGSVITTGGNTARYVAGATAGSFAVTATSVADSSRRATATITILNGPRGVTKTRSRGVATAGVVNASDGGRCGFRDSPAGASSWSDSFSCSGFYSDDTISGTVSATASAAFTETFEAGELVGVVATGIGGGTELGLAIGSAQGTYILEFRVTRPTRTRVRADVTGIFGSDMVFSLFGPGVNVFTRDEVAYDEVLTLAPGNYFVQMVGGGVNAGAFFSLQMEFGV
jgi:hypothetical protein